MPALCWGSLTLQLASFRIHKYFCLLPSTQPPKEFHSGSGAFKRNKAGKCEYDEGQKGSGCEENLALQVLGVAITRRPALHLLISSEKLTGASVGPWAVTRSTKW